MKVINTEMLASVAVIQTKGSEEELAVYEAALSCVLDSQDGSEIEWRFGASIDEIEEVRGDLREAIAQRGAA